MNRRGSRHRAETAGAQMDGSTRCGICADGLAARVWNLYFLVPTGRGQFVSDMTPAQYDGVLAALYRIQKKYDGRMLVNAKCAPHYIKTVLENAGTHPGPMPPEQELATSAAPGLSRIRTYSGGAGGCPAGTHYMGIRPNGTSLPVHLPFSGTLRARLSRTWVVSPLLAHSGAARSGVAAGSADEKHCGGCRARVRDAGDMMAEDPSAAHPGTSRFSTRAIQGGGPLGPTGDRASVRAESRDDCGDDGTTRHEEVRRSSGGWVSAPSRICGDASNA